MERYLFLTPLLVELAFKRNINLQYTIFHFKGGSKSIKKNVIPAQPGFPRPRE